MKESKQIKERKTWKKKKAIWLLFNRAGWELSEIGKLFGLSKTRVWDILCEINDEVVAEITTFQKLEEPQ